MNLFGPIFRYELIHIARRQRLTFSRCAFALGLFGIAALVYFLAYKEARAPLALRDIARITEGLFYALFGILFAAGAMFTPHWTADAITGEKERRTLPFLLLTDLSSREIILGKLASRLAQIALFILAALPVLVGLQFFGGVDPMIVLLGAAALGATIWSVGSLSMLWSVYARTPKLAAQRTGQLLALYIVGAMIAGQVLRSFPAVANWPTGSPVTLYSLLEWLNVGNPLVAIEEIARAPGSTFYDVFWSVFRWYFFSHILAGLAFTSWAIARLRPVAASAPLDSPPPETSASILHKRPRVGDRPVYWKMLHCDVRTSKTALARVTTRVVYVVSFLPVLGVLAMAAAYGNPRSVQESINVYIRLVGTLVMGGVILYSTGMTAGCIGRERIKQTLDDLLLTDLSTDEILRQKWLGAVWAPRWMFLWVALHWLLAVIVGALHPLSVPILAILWLAYLYYATNLGNYFAARTPTLQKAHVWTTLTGFLLAVAPLSAGMMLLWITRGRESWHTGVMMLSPPAALGTSAFSVENFREMQRGEVESLRWLTWGIVVGSLIHVVVGAILWQRAKRWFPRMIGR